MVSISEHDRDSLHFLWTRDLTSDPLELTIYRFTRIVFMVSSSPFLLNATINHHMSSYTETDSIFVKKFLLSIYVNDVVSGASDLDSACTFHLKSRLRLATAGFKKFRTNSHESQTRIQQNKPVEQANNKRSICKHHSK